MERVLLTPEQMHKLQDAWCESPPETRGSPEDCITKAQLKRVGEWGDERIMCEHLPFYHKRIGCEQCWYELLKEAGIK